VRDIHPQLHTPLFRQVREHENNVAKPYSILQERLRRLDAAGNPATKKGDLFCLAVKNEIPFVVSWDGATIHVERREAKNPFCIWFMERRQFDRLFLEDLPPILIAMNKDQTNIKMRSNHHNGSLVVSF
jgi:hypothetical protein